MFAAGSCGLVRGQTWERAAERFVQFSQDFSKLCPLRYIKIGDKEVEYHPNFRLILHTKYFNPHYKPEMQAQCTLINFLVTRDGLEDQLLAAVVAKERPDLEELKVNGKCQALALGL